MGKLTTMREANALRAADAPSSKILLVGESNPYGGPESNALVPWPERCAGHRLQSKILGVPEELYLSMHRRNLCSGSWSRKRARERAIGMLRNEHPWDLIVMLGRQVSDAFGSIVAFGEATRFGWIDPDDDPRRVSISVDSLMIRRKQFTLLALPHPSGRNTLWNSSENIARARDLLRKLAPDVPWGSLECAR